MGRMIEEEEDGSQSLLGRLCVALDADSGVGACVGYYCW